MEYHYQWPEYLDPTSSEGNGWESMCASPTTFRADTPAMPSCMPRVFSRGRPMRRRRLFPPPFNHFARGVRPQWSTPYYDCRYKWSSKPHVSNVCPPQFDACYDYESLLDKESTDKQFHTPAKKNRKNKGTSKPVQAAKNSDQSILGSNRIEWIENSQQNECKSPSGSVKIGHHASISSPVDSLCKSPGDQDSAQSTLVSVCNNESRKANLSQNDFPVSVKVSAQGSENYFSENEKEDILSSIISSTLCEASKNVTNDGQDIIDSHNNQLREEPIKLYQGPRLINPDPSQNENAENSEFFSSSQSISKNSYCDELPCSGSIRNFPNEISKEIELAIFNIQQVDQDLDAGSQYPNMYGDGRLSSNQQNVNNKVKTSNSLVACNPQNIPQSVSENITTESENYVNTTEIKCSQFSENNNSQPCSSEKEDSISSLVQQNQLLTDLLSQLISGDIEIQKNVFASNQLLPETDNSTGEVQINLMEGSIPECSSFQTISGKDPVNVFQNFPDTVVNIPAEITLQPRHAQETNVNNYLSEQSTNINSTKPPKCSDKILKACEVIPVATVGEFTTGNSFSIETSDVSIPDETFPSNIDYPSSDSDSNLREATLSSVTNYILEDPLETFPDSLISMLDDESSLDILSSCVKPNSVLKVKKPRKRYIKTFESFKVKRKEKNVCKTSSKRKKLTSNCMKVIRKCKHKICKEERNSDEDYRGSYKELHDAEVQVGESDIKTKMVAKVPITCDVGTQWEVLENHCNSHHDALFLKDDLSRDYKTRDSNTNFVKEEETNTREKNSLIKDKDVLVMLVEIPLDLKKLSKETGSLKVELLDNSRMPSRSNGQSQMTSNRCRVIESFATTSDSKIENFGIKYDDACEARPSIKSKIKYNQDAVASRSDHTTPISKSYQSKDITKGSNLHISRKLSEIQKSASATKTPDLYGGRDRVLRKRKAVNYSDPGPLKRKRFDNEGSEVEFVNDKPKENVKNGNLNTNLSGVDKNCRSRSNMSLRNRNSSEFFRGNQRSEEQLNKSQRPKSG